LEDPAEIGEQTWGPPRPPAPADMTTRPHQKACLVPAIGSRERALPIMERRDARPIRQTVRRGDRDDPQATPKPRMDLLRHWGEMRHVPRGGDAGAICDENVLDAALDVEQARRKADAAARQSAGTAASRSPASPRTQSVPR